jgi:hypothetical protein
MISLMHAYKQTFRALPVKDFYRIFIFGGFPLFFLFNAPVSAIDDSLKPSIDVPYEPGFMDDTQKDSYYSNYAQKDAYENEPWFSPLPQWQYFDMFGNKLLDGYYLYGLTMDRNTQGGGISSNIALHPFVKKMMNGLVQVSDLHENSGILAMMGDRVKSEFTPFTLKQTLFAGTRLDGYYKENSLSLLTNRISQTGYYGMYTNESRPMPAADWLTGVHGVRRFGEIAGIGGTYTNLHHEESKDFSNPFSGVDSDTSAKGTPNGLSLYGLNANLNHAKLQAYGEYVRSQEFLDGNFKAKPGTVATLNAQYDLWENWRCGGEFYTIGSKFKTSISCPAHYEGDQFGGIGKYQYSLIEDNDDRDDYPENGQTRFPYFPIGDPDGVIPINYDKDKNGVYDYEEDFLGYEADPPRSKILLDRNNNGVPDEIENDAYPDYTYVPSYYLPGEKYWRRDDINGTWENKGADSLTHKGLVGCHLYSRYKILHTVLPSLEMTAGGIFDKSQEKTFQRTYKDGNETGEVYDAEYATTLYLMVNYKKDIAKDKIFRVDNYFRRTKDNIPNHTQGVTLLRDSAVVQYYLIPDRLECRDMFANALRAEFTLFKNRGFNYTAAGKLEFQKNFPHLEFDFPGENIPSFMLVNKCEYIYLLPFFKDLFLIPRYKNIYDYLERGAGASDSLDVSYRRNSMINTANLMCEWKCSARSALSAGLHLKKFDDFFDNKENYYEPSYSIQLRLKDWYKSSAIVLTTAFVHYAYIYEHPGRPHNPLNNVHMADDNMQSYKIFIKAYCGFL